MKKKFLPIAGYSALFILALSLFIIRGIDPEWAKENLITAARNSGGMVLTIRSVELSLPFSATIIDASLSDRNGKNKIRLDSLEVRPVFWKLLLFKTALEINMKVEGGWTKAEVSTGLVPSKIKFALESGKFPVSKAVQLLNGAELPLDADLDATTDITIPLKNTANIDGSVVVYLSGIKLKTGSSWAAMLSGSIPTTLKCRAEFKDKGFSTKECGAESTMGKIELRLASKLSDDIGNSPLTGAIVVKPSEKVAGVLGALYPQFKKPDGDFSFPVEGTANSPRMGI